MGCAGFGRVGLVGWVAHVLVRSGTFGLFGSVGAFSRRAGLVWYGMVWHGLAGWVGSAEVGECLVRGSEFWAKSRPVASEFWATPASGYVHQPVSRVR